uniref:Perilipin n=1 Tax=Rhabditophanes sp. KR3021 TaxID=114890 RepID=A0AC35U688_9BILA
MSAQVQTNESVQDGINRKVQELYTTVASTPIGKIVENGYNTAKTSSVLMERACSNIEGGVSSVATGYVLPTAVKVVENYNYGFDSTQKAVDKTKQVANVGAAYGLATIVAGIQMSLLAGVNGVNYALDTASATKDLGTGTIQYVSQVKAATTEKVASALEKTINLANKPKDIATNQVNYVLDVTQSYVELVCKTPIPRLENPENVSIVERLSALMGFITSNLIAKGNDQYLSPLIENVYSQMNKLKQNFIMLELFKKERESLGNTITGVSEKYSKLKERIREEATKINVAPEQFLLNQIRTTTDKLDESAELMKIKGENLFSPQINGMLIKVISTIRDFDATLNSSKSVYDIKNEVIQTIVNVLNTVLSFISKDTEEPKLEDFSDNIGTEISDAESKNSVNNENNEGKNDGNLVAAESDNNASD